MCNEGVAAHCAGSRPAARHRLRAAADRGDRAARTRWTLGLHGVEISTFEPGIDLSSAQLAGFWARAEELGALVFIHPWGCSLDERLRGSYMFNLVGQPVEHTVALSHIIMSGRPGPAPAAADHRGARGGYLPFMPGADGPRVAGAPGDHDAGGAAPSTYLRRIFFDSVVFDPDLLGTLVERVGADRVLLGTDFPFDMGVEDPVALVEAAPLDDYERRGDPRRDGGRALLGIAT